MKSACTLFYLLTIQLLGHSDVIDSEVTNGAPTTQENSCTTLASNESTIVNRDIPSSPLSQKYRLTRIGSSKKYRVELNLHFNFSHQLISSEFSRYNPDPQGQIGASRLSLIRDELTARILGRVNTCFRENQSRLSDSNGYSLELVALSSPSESRAPINQVEIAPSSTRSSSKAWERDIDCPTIIHESLHLMGLCDGYQEKVNTRQSRVFSVFRHGLIDYAYNCRAEEPVNSIMHNQNIALTPQINTRVCVFSSSQSSTDSITIDFTATQRAFDSNRQNGRGLHFTRVTQLQLCPQGTSAIDETLSQSDLQRLREKYRFSGQSGTYVTIQPRQNALYPAQTRFIVNPGCDDLNNRYLTCLGNAYRTKNREGCLSVPDYCQNGDHLN